MQSTAERKRESLRVQIACVWGCKSPRKAQHINTLNLLLHIGGGLFHGYYFCSSGEDLGHDEMQQLRWNISLWCMQEHGGKKGAEKPQCCWKWISWLRTVKIMVQWRYYQCRWQQIYSIFCSVHYPTVYKSAKDTRLPLQCCLGWLHAILYSN